MFYKSFTYKLRKYRVGTQIEFLNSVIAEDIRTDIWESINAGEEFVIEFYTNDTTGKEVKISYLFYKASKETTVNPNNEAGSIILILIIAIGFGSIYIAVYVSKNATNMKYILSKILLEIHSTEV